MTGIDTEIRHITPADGNIFADLGFDAEEAARLKAAADAVTRAKLTLMGGVREWIKDNGYTQMQAAKILGVSRPRVSYVVNQKTGKFALDALVAMAVKTGKTVEITVR